MMMLPIDVAVAVGVDGKGKRTLLLDNMASLAAFAAAAFVVHCNWLLGKTDHDWADNEQFVLIDVSTSDSPLAPPATYDSRLAVPSFALTTS